MRTLIPICTGLAAALLAGCDTGGTVAGKPGGDQTENGIQAIVLDSSGAPTPGARVRVRPADWIASGTRADSLAFSSMDVRTDSTGGFRVLGLAPGNYRVEVATSGQALQFGVLLGDSLYHAGIHKLSRTGSILGRVSTGVGTLVGISGLDHFTRADLSGYFQLESLPAGVSEVKTADGSYAWATVAPRSVAQAGLLVADPPGQVLVDDFEDGDIRNRWAPLTGGGWWFVSTGDTSIHTTPAGLTSNPTAGVTATATSHGQVFHVLFSFPANLSNPWAEVGVGLGGPPANLSALAALSFQAKGSGTVAVLITSNNGGRLVANVALSANWTSIRIPLDSFKVEPYAAGSSPTVSDLLATANGLGWEFTSSSELWLDDIYLIGPDPQSVFGALQPP